MSSNGIAVVLPLLAIMLAGYTTGKLQLLPGYSSKAISRFVFLLAMPALIFVSLADVPLHEFFNWPYLAALGGGMLVIFVGSITVATLVFKENPATRSLHALTAMFSSTAYIGLPLILAVFGDAGLVPGIIGAVITGSVFMPLAIILAEIDNGRDSRRVVTTSVLAVIKNPLLIATVAGLVTSASGISLAAPIVSVLDLLGSTFIPCALFAAGLFISGCSLAGEMPEIWWLVLVKLLLHPLVTWWLAVYVLELDGILPLIAILQAALPSGVPVFVIAQQYGCFVSRSSAVIALSTALSVLTLPLVLFLIL